MKIPMPVNADAYSVTSNIFASKEAKEFSCYNFTNRYSPKNVEHWEGVAQDSRMVFFGLNFFIQKYLMKPITAEDVLNSMEFMESSHSFGQPSNFDTSLWMKVVNECGGYLPLKIEAIAEGSVFFPSEPIIQVSSLKDWAGELACHIEARLVGTVSIATACATLCRHWKESLNRESCPKEILSWYVHNFGSRSCSSEDEDILTGVAHLLSFNGTDNFAAAYYGWKNGLPRPVGTSISALAHRNISAHETETAAFHSIMKYNDTASYVADCYNYEKAVQILCEMGEDHPSKTIIIRPDSGSHTDVIRKIIQCCLDKNLFLKGEGNFLSPKNVRFIYGDSVTPNKMTDCLDVVESMTGNRFGWGIFGVGGFLRNSCTRDTLSSAYKLAAKGKDKESVVKLSETKGKLSVPGPSYLADTRFKCEPRVALDRGHSINNLMQLYYEYDNFCGLGINSPYSRNECLSSIRDRADQDFSKWDRSVTENPIFGLDRSSLNNDIKGIQDSFYEKYRSV